MKQAKLHSFFGAWIVTVNNTLFPRLFNSKKEALQIVEEINKKNNE